MVRRRVGARAAVLAVVATVALASASCAAGGGSGSPATRPPKASSHDPMTSAALLRIARTFNNDYAENKDAAVYARWDAASRAIISEATFVARHKECPNASGAKPDTWGVTRGPGHEWFVHYAIDGVQLTDTWFYVDGRFQFDLPKSNPSAVALYRSSPAQYAKKVGCAG